METQTDTGQSAEIPRPLSDVLEDGFRLYLRGFRPTLCSTLLFTALGAGAAAFIGHLFLLPLFDIVASRFANRHPDLLPNGVAAYVYGSAAALLLFLFLLSYFESLNLRALARLAYGKDCPNIKFSYSHLNRGFAFFQWMLLYILALIVSLLPLILILLYPPANLLVGLLLVTIAYLPCLYVTVTFALGPNSVIQDELGPLGAFGQNFKLVSPHWWRTLAFVLIAYTAVHTVITVFFVVFIGILVITGSGVLYDLTTLVRLLLVALGYGTFIGGVLSLPLFNALLVVFYNDLKQPGQTGANVSLN